MSLSHNRIRPRVDGAKMRPAVGAACLMMAAPSMMVMALMPMTLGMTLKNIRIGNPTGPDKKSHPLGWVFLLICLSFLFETAPYLKPRAV